MNDRIRFEGVTLTVASVDQSIAFYAGKLGLTLERDVSPAFALLRIGLGTIGLVAVDDARKSTSDASPDEKRAVHVEFSCDDLDGLYEGLKAAVNSARVREFGRAAQDAKLFRSANSQR